MPGKLTTHVLDISRGCPARELRLELWSLHGSERRLIKAGLTNADGRTEQPLLAGEEFAAGEYELVFYAGDYFSSDKQAGMRPFLDRIPVRFRVVDADASYHVPLLCSPWAYSTYRGS
jgi:5-hydroxyisourate hydrolase